MSFAKQGLGWGWGLRQNCIDFIYMHCGAVIHNAMYSSAVQTATLPFPMQKTSPGDLNCGAFIDTAKYSNAIQPPPLPRCIRPLEETNAMK